MLKINIPAFRGWSCGQMKTFIYSSPPLKNKMRRSELEDTSMGYCAAWHFKSLSVCRSLCLSLCLSLPVSVFLSASLSLSLFFSLSLSVCLSVCLNVSLSLSVSPSLSLSVSVCLSLSLSLSDLPLTGFYNRVII